MKPVDFTPTAHAQYEEWRRENKKIYDKINSLVKEIGENPFAGTGKPEPLKYNMAGCWSRRITKEHRLVYKVTSDSVIVISCKFHY